MRIGFRPLLASVALLAVTACGGGTGVRQTQNQPQPAPTSSPQLQHVHFIIGASGRRLTEVVPGAQQPALPRGARDGGVVPRAKITYPDGSTQTADANGGFDPSQSAYALKYAALLKKNAYAQPSVIITDPANQAPPAQAIVDAFAGAHRIQSRFVRSNRRVGLRDSATATNIAGVILLPDVATLVSTQILDLNAEGIDTNNNVLQIDGANITWSAQSGSVLSYPGTNEAVYVPPALDSGSLTDAITTTVTLPSGTTFSASTRVTVIGPSSTAAVSGTLYANGTPVAGGLATFAQQPLPQFFAPTYWLAGADDKGAYTIDLPAAERFSLAMGLPAAISPSGDFGLYVANTAAGASSYSSGAAATNAALDLYLGPGPVPFTDLPPSLQSWLPPYVAYIRDAWYATTATVKRVFEADSGIQPMLNAPPSTFPSPAQPAPITNGQFAKWCYQWQMLQGAATLVIIENRDTTCTAPGRSALAITPAGGATFSFVRYGSVTPYALTGTPDVITNSLLIEAGTWSQTLAQDTNGNITSDQANVQLGWYDQDHQVYGSPVYNETLGYAYSTDSNGLATVHFSNDTRSSGDDGSILSVLNATKSQHAALTASGCQNGSNAVCYTVTGSVDDGGTSYSIGNTIAGDGSATLTFQNTSTGDKGKMQMNLASESSSDSNGCLVCASAPGMIYDADGTTPIGVFTINNARLVQTSIYDTQPGSSTLGPNVIDALGFIL